MEYVQTVLVQIEADNIERASAPGGLLAELDEHRQYLRQQEGFREMRVTRSINPEGNVLLVIETRWSDDAGLVRYETSEPNVASIVRKHGDMIVPNSLQVLDMEALRTETEFRAAEAAAEARARLALPLVIPAGILAFMLLVIYGFSRIYLEIRGDGAVALAAVASIGILIIAFYVAANPRLPAWQIGGIMAVAAVALAAGTAWALIQEDETIAEEPEPPPANGEPAPPPGENVMIMGDDYFELDGERNPAIPVAPGEQISFELPNQGNAIHNMVIAGEDNEYGTDDDVISDPRIVNPGDTATIEWTAPETPGTYDFHCEFHAVDMVGTFIVQ
jgi:heme-degrading monooxygenase HmoA